MDLESRLARGTCGVRWRPPEGATLVERAPGAVTWRAGPVAYRARWRSLPFALAPGEEPALRADLEASARHAFVAYWTTAGDRRAQPRTATGWSPIVEAHEVELPGGPALSVIARRAHEPAVEAVVAHLIVPVATGHLDLEALVIARPMAAREAVLAAMRPPGAPPLTQAEIDSADHDLELPAHPLTLARRAHARLVLDAEVTAPAAAPPPAGAAVTLPRSGCAIVAPPRFRAIADERAVSVDALTRLGLDGWGRTLDVMRVPIVVRPAVAGAMLDQLAERSAASLEVRHSQQARVGDFEGRIQIDQDLVFARAGVPRRAYLRWFADHDGAVFRIGCESDAPMTMEVLRDDVLATQARWRRLDADR